MRAVLALVGLPLMFLWWCIATPLGWAFTAIAIPSLVVAGVYNLVCGPMSDADVPNFVYVDQVVQGPHSSGASFHDVVTIAVTNTHSRRETPAGLWVACTVHGRAMQSSTYLGDYESLRAFEAQPLHDYNGKSHVQSIPAGESKNIDFDTQAATPDLTLAIGERVTQCVAGASEKQALALAGYNADDPHSHLSRMLNTTPLARQLGMTDGWQK